jgi:hypothetical protein
MRLIWRRSSRVEDRFETWIARRHQDRVLSGETAPVGPCPEKTFLRELARKSRRISLTDPRVDHAANCPACMSKLLTLRRENRSRQRRLAFALAAASCVVIAVVIISLSRFGVFKQATPPNMATAFETVDLSNSGSYRGEQPGSLQSVSLPHALVRLTIILPRFSQSGEYLVAVTRDHNGNDVLAEGHATAINRGDSEVVSVDLNLRQAKAGSYFFSTTHEQDQATYYYPLQIK